MWDDIISCLGIVGESRSYSNVFSEFILGTPGIPGQIKFNFEKYEQSGNGYVLSKIL